MKTTTTTTIMIMVLVAAAIGMATSRVAVNSAFAGVQGPHFNNPGQCHQFANGIGVPHGKDISKSTAQFCKGQHSTQP